MLKNGQDSAVAPRLVAMVVTNQVLGDSRVEKSAASVAAAGFEVTVLGVSPVAERVETSLGDARLIRVPVDFALNRLRSRDHERKRKRRKARGRWELRALRRRTTIARLQMRPQSESKKDARAVSRSGVASSVRRLLRVAYLLFLARANTVDHALGSVHKLVVQTARSLAPCRFVQSKPARSVPSKTRTVTSATGARRRDARPVVVEDQGERGRTAAAEVAGFGRFARVLTRLWHPRRVRWRRELPALLDLEMAMVPSLVALRPDLIHAHDHTAIAVAHHAATLLRATGHQVRVLYDAHEYVRGVPTLEPRRLQAHIQLEDGLIRKADAVVTVSPSIADRLQREHGLDRRPAVVLNAPVVTPEGLLTSAPSVRRAANLADDVPLLVYSGSVKAQRGVDTMIRALAMLPGVHCAVVAQSDTHRGVLKVLECASAVGCRDRVHIVPYVEQRQITAYLSSADIGVHTLLPSGNANLALPTKIFEYMHAGLPVVASDLPEMGRIVKKLGLGETFPSGDSEGFAVACRRVLENPQRYGRPAADPQTRRRYSWEAQAEVLVATYEQVLGNEGPRGALPPEVGVAD